MTESTAFISNTIQAFLEPAKRQTIPQWMAENFRLPSETAEAGLYDPKRAPYQIEILEAMSPQNPTRKISMCFGTQMGKTLIEEGGMCYYCACYPRPQGFAFSNDGELKGFVKTKFDPVVRENPVVKRLFGMGSRSTGDTVSEKLYPGGFLRFISANTEANMRGYSIAVLFADEIDTYPKNVGGNGDPIDQLENRTTAFPDTKKIAFSSTPANDYSLILTQIEQSTHEKYNVPCPHCRKLFTFELEHFHYATNEEGLEVTDAWMECPNCGYLIRNKDKTWMLDPANGAKWVPTNPGAPKENRGFFLPSFYSPEGMGYSFKQLAQRWHNARTQKDDAKRLNMLTSFYNTALCRQYHELMDTPDTRVIMQRGADSLCKRGIAPNWVNVITTGGDVQANRLEITIMGWGRRLRHIPIDHYILHVPPGEEIKDLDGTVWREYYEKILCGMWEREDGFVLRSVANALDRSYESRTIDNIFRRYQSATFHPVRGVSDPKGLTVVPTRKQTRTSREDTPVIYYDVPVDQIKAVIYRDLVKKDSDAVYSYEEFPDGYSEEFYSQLISEHLVLNPKTNLQQWEKIRDRNEILDTHVYNYAMCYVAGLDGLLDEDWDSLAAEQREIAKTQKDGAVLQQAREQRRRRVISSGIR